MDTARVCVCVCVWETYACFCECVSLSDSDLDVAAQLIRGDPVTRAGRKRAMQSATHGSHTRAHTHTSLSPPPNVSLMRWISWMQQMCAVQTNTFHLSVITHTHTAGDTQHMIDGHSCCAVNASSYMALYIIYWEKY